MIPLNTSSFRPIACQVIPHSVAASTAYLLAQKIDRIITGNNYDDLVLWGGVVSAKPDRQRLIGLAVHYSLGASLAIGYQLLAPRYPRVPHWLRATLFVQVENTLLFPGVAIIDRIHPAVRRGDLPGLWTWNYFWLEAVRHAAYGVVLGVLSERGTRT